MWFDVMNVIWIFMSWSNQTTARSPRETELTSRIREHWGARRQPAAGSESGVGGGQGSQPQLHVVAEPGGLHHRLRPLLAGPHGGRQVAEVVSDLEGDHHVGVALLLGDHLDEEADLVGLPEGDHAGGGEKRERETGEVGMSDSHLALGCERARTHSGSSWKSWGSASSSYSAAASFPASSSSLVGTITCKQQRPVNWFNNDASRSAHSYGVVNSFPLPNLDSFCLHQILKKKLWVKPMVQNQS